MSNLFNFKTVDQLQAFVKEIKSLRELVKCTVCFEVTNNPVRIVCDHIFCSDCLDTLVNTFKDQAPKKIPQCPVCRKAINRQRNPVNGYVESLLAFLRGIDASVQSTFGCDILALSEKKNIEGFFKQKISYNGANSVIAATDYQEDAFDKLLKSDTENPIFKGKYGKKYGNKNVKQKDTAVPTLDKLKTFENTDTKIKIHQWLEDTKNRFDRLTQTQCVDSDGVSVQSSLDMPSVSQIDYGQPSQKEQSRTRPRSFELKPKVPIVEVKRHSITGESQEVVEVIEIEDFEESEDVQSIANKEEVLRLLEEECLNSIDLEVEVENKKKRPKLRELKPSNSRINRNGWKRMNTVNKTLNKNTRKKNKLNVTLMSPVGKENVTNSTLTLSTRQRNAIKRPVVMLERLDAEYSIIKGELTKITKNKPKNTSTKQKGNSNIEAKDNIGTNIEETKVTENEGDDFICIATRLTKTKHKLASNSCFSKDQCSENCRLSKITTAEPISLLAYNFDDAEQTLQELKTVLKSKSHNVDELSLGKLKTTLNDLFDVLNGTELLSCNYNKSAAAISTQTVYSDVKSIAVQTEKNEIDNKKVSSIGIQTENFTCDVGTIAVSFNNEDERKFDDDFAFNTQKVTDVNATVTETIRSPLALTQKINDEKDNEDIKMNNSSVMNIKDDINDKSSQNVNEDVTNSKPSASAKKSTLNSHLLFSLSNHRISSKEECEERIAQVSRRYKRIRTLDMDSDENSFAKKMKIKNKFLADDLSIQMISENMTDDVYESKPANNSHLSLNNCNDVDYDAYLVNIMKKHEDNPSGNNVTKTDCSRNQPSTSKKTESQVILERCDAMIKKLTSIQQSNKDQNQETHKNLKTTGTCTKTKIHKDEVEEHIADITISESPIDLEMIQEFDKPFDQKLSHSRVDKESGTLPCTDTFMENIDIEELENTSSELECDLNGTVRRASPRRHTNVVILQNILLNAKDSIDQKRQEDNDQGSVGSEDLFNSENDELVDEDVVETTPKSMAIHRSSSSQLRPKSLINQLLPLPVDSPDVISSIDLTSFLDQTFTPPVDFQDANNDDDNQNMLNLDGISYEDFEVTLVPPRTANEQADCATVENKVANNRERNKNVIDLSLLNSGDFNSTMFTSGAVKNNVDCIMRRRNVEENKRDRAKYDFSVTESEVLRLINNQKSSNIITSTQNSFVNENFESLGMSPICKEKRKNPIEIAKGSRFSCLEVISLPKPETSKSRPTTPLATKQRSILSFVKADKIDKNESIISIASSKLSPSPKTKPRISCTRLNKNQMLSVSALSDRKLIHYTNTFSPLVTHIIVSVNKQNCLEDHTMKVLLAVAHGKWVVNFDWIKDCLAEDRIVPEEAYEALDMSGLPGPKISRLKRKGKPLLQRYKIHLEPPFLSAAEQDIEQLVTVLGGEIVADIHSLTRQDGIRLIITEAKSTQDYYKCEQWLAMYKVVAVDIEWLSRSIGRYEVVSLRPFALCSDDNINSLGYPPELTVETSFSYSQSMCATNR